MFTRNLKFRIYKYFISFKHFCRLNLTENYVGICIEYFDTGL